MHVVTLVVIGLIVLGAFVAMGRVCYNEGGAGKGAHFFFQVWLVVAIVNGVYGVLGAKLPILNELGAFVVIFGVPAAVAFYLSRRFRPTAQ